MRLQAGKGYQPLNSPNAARQLVSQRSTVACLLSWANLVQQCILTNFTAHI